MASTFYSLSPPWILWHTSAVTMVPATTMRKFMNDRLTDVRLGRPVRPIFGAEVSRPGWESIIATLCLATALVAFNRAIFVASPLNTSPKLGVCNSLKVAALLVSLPLDHLFEVVQLRKFRAIVWSSLLQRVRTTLSGIEFAGQRTCDLPHDPSCAEIRIDCTFTKLAPILQPANCPSH